MMIHIIFLRILTRAFKPILLQNRSRLVVVRNKLVCLTFRGVQKVHNGQLK